MCARCAADAAIVLGSSPVLVLAWETRRGQCSGRVKGRATRTASSPSASAAFSSAIPLSAPPSPAAAPVAAMAAAAAGLPVMPAMSCSSLSSWTRSSCASASRVRCLRGPKKPGRSQRPRCARRAKSRSRTAAASESQRPSRTGGLLACRGMHRLSIFRSVVDFDRGAPGGETRAQAHKGSHGRT